MRLSLRGHLRGGIRAVNTLKRQAFRSVWNVMPKSLQHQKTYPRIGEQKEPNGTKYTRRFTSARTPASFQFDRVHHLKPLRNQSFG